MEYTQGPWIVKHEFNVMSPTGNVVAGCGGHQQNFEEENNRLMNIANAHLISSAPDMYEALKICVKRLQCLEENGHGEAIIANALKAIAKAEGRE
jgi:hypothetical protein